MKGRLKIVWTEFTLSVFRRPFPFQSAMKKRQSDGHHLNEKAIKLYKKNGFEEISVRKNYYGNHQNALIMIKNS